MFDPLDSVGAQAAREEGEALLRRARDLYPDSIYLQSEWLRAVLTVRLTRKGWLLDGTVGRDIPEGISA